MKVKRDIKSMSPDKKGLPPWFSRPTPGRTTQQTLFPEHLHRVLAQLKVSVNELSRWHKAGWVSFDSTSARTLEREQVAEIIFVRDILRAGLPDAYSEMLIKQIPKPLGVDPDKVSYSFRHGWVITDPPGPFEQIEEHLDEWLEHLVEAGEAEKLIELRDKIADALKDLSEQE